VKYLLLVMSPLTAVFVFCAGDILRLWIGTDFAAHSTAVLQLIALSIFLNAFAWVPYSSVQALGRPELKSVLDIIVLPLYAVSSWYLMRLMGINGAALAKLAVTILDTVCLFGFAWRMKAFALRDCISGPLLRALTASAGLFIAGFGIAALHARLAVALPLLGICSVLYVATFWIVAVDEDEKFVIRSIPLLLLLKRQLSS
jgi:O-antigen/teichoic acid export membrane protein